MYWEELAPDKAEKSLFRRRSSVAQSMGQDVAAIALPAEDVKDLAQLFSAKATTAPATNTAEGGKAVAGGRKTPPKASVIDGRRLQNVGIISSFFRRAFPSMDDMVRSVLTLNRDRIPVERVSGLIEVMPTPEEQKKLLPLRAQATQLSEAEQFMLSMMKVGISRRQDLPHAEFHKGEGMDMRECSREALLAVVCRCHGWARRFGATSTT